MCICVLVVGARSKCARWRIEHTKSTAGVGVVGALAFLSHLSHILAPRSISYSTAAAAAVAAAAATRCDDDDYLNACVVCVCCVGPCTLHSAPSIKTSVYTLNSTSKRQVYTLQYFE